MTETELKPCPFCGGEVVIREPIVKGEARYIVHKDVAMRPYCAVEFSDFNIDEDLARAWNTRAQPTDEARKSALEKAYNDVFGLGYQMLCAEDKTIIPDGYILFKLSEMPVDDGTTSYLINCKNALETAIARSGKELP